MNGYKKYLKSLVANYKMKFVRLFAELYKESTRCERRDYMISKIVTSIPVTYDTLHKPGLNMNQCLILQLIKTYDDGIGTEVSNKVIANFFSITPRTVSSSIGKLEKLKYISTIYDRNKAIRIIHVLEEE